MPRTSFDQSAGFQFLQSAGRQRNRSADNSVIMDQIYVDRSSLFDPANAFFNAWIRCRQVPFSIIPPGRIAFEAHFWESDDNVGLSSAITGVSPGSVWVDTSPDDAAIETPPPYVPGPSHTYFHNLLSDSSIAEPVNPAYRSAFNLVDYHLIFDDGVSGVVIKAVYRSMKTRFRLNQGLILGTGFIAKGRIIYRTDDFGSLGAFQTPVDISELHLEFTGSFLPGQIYEIGQPNDFNFEEFRFAMINETPNQWTARTGKAFV